MFFKVYVCLIFAFVLMGQTCEPQPPPVVYCEGAVAPTFLARAIDYIETIIGGDPSSDRRATAKVLFNQASCSGVVMGPHTVLTAAHCGYATNAHIVEIDGISYPAPEHLYHPAYQGWIDSLDPVAREHDVMLLFTTDTLPPPYMGNRFYDSSKAGVCTGLIAQGWGDEGDPEAPNILRESSYLVTEERDRTLVTEQATPGSVCYGDSGGPLYAVIGSEVYLAGTTSTGVCNAGSIHIKTSAFISWIRAGIR